MKRYTVEELKAAGLTERQIEIYSLISSGLSPSEAARRLGVTKANISIHMKRALKKLERYESVKKIVEDKFEERLEKIEEDVKLLKDVVMALIIGRC
ncbi:MAG: LuxR C-terminal-related transcriptional regulator [Candidatus Nezhaarchaeales archaeon]